MTPPCGVPAPGKLTLPSSGTPAAVGEGDDVEIVAVDPATGDVKYGFTTLTELAEE
jgi:hypothetical protein